MDWITRASFDRLLHQTFPQAETIRVEQGHGWCDSIDLNILRIRVTVFLSGVNEGRVLGEILGIRATIDHSEARLWHVWGQGESGLHRVFSRLREVTLGLAAAFLLITEDPHNLPDPMLGLPPPPEETDLDLASLLRVAFPSR